MAPNNQNWATNLLIFNMNNNSNIHIMKYETQAMLITGHIKRE